MTFKLEAQYLKENIVEISEMEVGQRYIGISANNKLFMGFYDGNDGNSATFRPVVEIYTEVDDSKAEIQQVKSVITAGYSIDETEKPTFYEVNDKTFHFFFGKIAAYGGLRENEKLSLEEKAKIKDLLARPE